MFLCPADGLFKTYSERYLYRFYNFLNEYIFCFQTLYCLNQFFVKCCKSEFSNPEMREVREVCKNKAAKLYWTA